MSCIARIPRCGNIGTPSPAEATPLSKIGSIITTISGIIGAITTLLTLYGKLAVVNNVLVVGGTTTGGVTTGGVAIAGAAGMGAIGGALGAIAVLVVIAYYQADRCQEGDGSSECISGVVREIIKSFDSTLDDLFPFTAMHNRVDVVVKSIYWDIIETNFARVFCTEEEIPRRSEIMRSYYFTEQVCKAAKGAVIGGVTGAVAGVVAGALIAAAIGCSTLFLCLFAILIAALVAATAVLIGALAGGQIAKATTSESSPTDSSGIVIPVGALLSVHGNMKRRENDEGANVFWWVKATDPHGIISSSVAQPYSYCELDSEITQDSCPLASLPPSTSVPPPIG